MRQIDLMSVDHCVSGEKLDDPEAPDAGSHDGGPVDVEVKLGEPGCMERIAGKPVRRGRPPRSQVKAMSSPRSALSQPRKRREEEDVCFVCFDGGSLVLCDRRGCPKAYHPACVKRTEAFFKSRSKWNCGWHICTTCQKDSFYMCYTCPYSACKRCVRSAEYVAVRGNKGFCGICKKTILLIENAAEANKEKVQVDFDDQGSWEYLFKIYWVSLKEKLALSLDELTKAKNPWKSASAAAKARRASQHCDQGDGNVSFSNHSRGDVKVNRAKIRKTETTSVDNLGSLDSNKSLGDRSLPLPGGTAWATQELLEFVRYMKNDDTSSLSKYDVQTLVLEHVARNNLQDPCQSSQIVCDSRLVKLFGKERVDHLEMLKLLDSHFICQEKSPVSSTASRGGADAIPSHMEAGRSGDRFKAFEWYQGRESQVLNLPNVQVGSCTSGNGNQAGARAESSFFFSKEFPSASTAEASEPVDGLDANIIWQYQDPTGKIHGPFSMSNLRQWSTTGRFPPDLRIWRLDEKQDDSILLTDALSGRFHKTGSLQNHTKLEQTEVKAVSNDCNRIGDVAKTDSRRLDVSPSPNSLSTDLSVISSSNSVVTGNSAVSNKSANSVGHTVPLDFALSSERQAVGSSSTWNKSKDDGPLLGQSQVSFSLSLATLPGDSSGYLSHERWHSVQTDANNNAVDTAYHQNGSGLSCVTEKQVTAEGITVHSCGQNWKAATPTSALTAWDCNSGLVSFTDNQEIDFLDLLSPTFRSSLTSTASDWQPIVADPDECDESVSDLLAEAEARESQKGLPPSPTSAFRGPTGLTQDFVNDCFSPAAMSSTNDLQLPSRSNITDC